MTTRLWAVALAATVAGGGVQATYIVDTGPGREGETGGTALISSGSSFQHLGATFEVQSATSIALIQGWIGVFSPGPLEIQLHASGSPQGAPLYAASVTLDLGANAWRGAAGLNWDVSSGTYTIAFLAGPGLSAYMDFPVPNPLSIEWYSNDGNSGAWLSSPLNAGWRVAAIPEPATYSLMALGLMAVGAAVRRRAAG